MCVVVFISCIRFSGSLGVRNINKCLIIRFRIISKLDVLDDKCIRTFISAITIDIELTGYSLVSTVDSQVQTGLLTNNSNFRDVRQQCNRYITGHFMRCI